MLKILLILLYFVNKHSCDSNQSKDPFEELGIPAFNITEMLENKEPMASLSYQLESINDLPIFIQSGVYKTRQGIKVLMKFFLKYLY